MPEEDVQIKKKFRTPRGDSEVSADSSRKLSNGGMSSEFIIDKIKKFEAKTKLAIQES